MTQSEIVNKMAMEMALKLGDLCHLKTCKFYIGLALTIGTEYFTRNMEEIVAMTREGLEIGRYKSEIEAAEKLGLSNRSISNCLLGKRYSTGGYLFIRAKDKLLIKREEE